MVTDPVSIFLCILTTLSSETEDIHPDPSRNTTPKFPEVKKFNLPHGEICACKKQS